MTRFAVAIGGVVISVAAVAFGAWWAPFLVGAAMGVVLRARYAIPSAALIGLLAWGLPLGVEQVRYGLVPTSQSLAAIMGFSHAPVVPLILTCVVGLLLGLTGAWLGSAVGALFARRQPAISR